MYAAVRLEEVLTSSSGRQGSDPVGLVSLGRGGSRSKGRGMENKTSTAVGSVIYDFRRSYYTWHRQETHLKLPANRVTIKPLYFLARDRRRLIAEREEINEPDNHLATGRDRHR